MPTKRLFVPDDIIYPGTTDKNIRLLQYVNATGQENFDAFLTHHALVYILTGMKQIKTAQSQFNIHLNPEKPDVPLNKNDAFQKVQKRRVQEKR